MREWEVKLVGAEEKKKARDRGWEVGIYTTGNVVYWELGDL